MTSDRQEIDVQYKNDVLQADYVKTNGLGGSMVWAMDLDDIHGVCGFGKNPLMSKLKEVLTNGNVVTQSPTTVVTNSPTQSPTSDITNSPTNVPTSDVNQPSTQTPPLGGINTIYNSHRNKLNNWCNKSVVSSKTF